MLPASSQFCFEIYPPPHVALSKKSFFYDEELLALHQTLKKENHPFSDVPTYLKADSFLKTGRSDTEPFIAGSIQITL